MARVSSIRAGYTKLALSVLRQRDARERDAVRAALPPESLQAVRRASALTFLAAEHHARIADATVDVFGARWARVFWRDVMLSAFDRALLRPFVIGASHLYGRAPSSLMRMTPQAWSLVWHGCGRSWMESVSSRHAVMRFEQLPGVIARSHGVLLSFVANCDAAIAYFGNKGAATPDERGLGAGHYSIDVEWS